MTSPAPIQSAKNAAPTAHRIDLVLGGQDRPFLTVSLDTAPEDRRHHINSQPLAVAESPKLENPNGGLRPLVSATQPRAILSAREVPNPDW